MEKIASRWGRFGITRKFGLIFSFLLSIIFVIGSAAFLSFAYINHLGSQIAFSNTIVRHVLDMDRGMEKARRLHGDFFLHYQRIGLQKAHETYAQPSIREISRVIAMSSEIKGLLFSKDSKLMEEIKRADVNLFLASAERFAETSIEAIELISRRSAPERGIETEIAKIVEQLRKMLRRHPRLFTELADAQGHHKDYLLSRKRYEMQSALNSYYVIRNSAESDTVLPPEFKKLVSSNIRNLEILTNELLDIDLKIASRLRDFSLQAQQLEPISKTLVSQTREIAKKAENQIVFAYLTTIIIILVSIILAIAAIVTIARLVHKNITTNVLNLTEAARDFSEGRLNVRVEKSSSDELGQLAEIFNNMADRLSDLIENLEIKVAQRTMQLSISEERFRTLVNELPQIAVQGINKDREIIYWNRTSETLLGYSKSAVMGRELEKLIFPKHRQLEIEENLSRWLAGGKALTAEEQILIDINGEEKPVYTAYEIQTNSLDEKNIYCVHLDLAELKLAQSQRQISESIYRQLFDHSSSGVAVYEVLGNGEDFIFKDFNRAAEKIEHISKEEVLGKSVMDVFPGVKDLGLLDAMKSVYLTAEPILLPVGKYEDDRIEGWRENRIYKLPMGEIVTVYNDATKQKKTEQERSVMELRLQRAQKMEAIGLMAGGIAHDLNNILSATVGYPELLLMQLAVDSELRKPIEAIRDAGERAATVVADLLTVARGVASARTTADINSLTREYLDSPEFYQLSSLHPHVQFETDFEEGLPPIECSPVHVKKCIMNLATNGAEAIQTNGSILFKTSKAEPDKKWLRAQGLEHSSFIVLSVRDSGTGIGEKDIEHIFEPFYTKKVMGKRSGTGLGLSVVWNTMKEHNGTVLVDSNTEGTSFDLYFPEAEDTIYLSEDKISIGDVRGGGEKILVVDDEQPQCDLACTILEHLGYSVDYVLSGEEAVDYLKTKDADIVLLDMLMEPGINGRETYRRIKEIKPSQKAVIASGFSENEDVKVTIEMGAGCFVKKPYTIIQLGVALQGQLEESDKKGGSYSRE